MKVQLIHPPIFLNVHAMTALRPSLPLGLAYIAGALRRAGHEVSILDAVAEAPDQVTQGRRKQLFALGLTTEQLVDRLDPTADVFGVTNMWSFSWPLVREILAEMKRRYPNTPIVAGGEHFTGLPEFSMNEAPIDFIVLGEGEEGAVEVLDGIANGRTDWQNVAGLVYRDAAGAPVRSLQVRARNKAVDDIAWPAWDLVKIDVYNDHNYVNGIKTGKTIPILATRGCPYQCTYCSSPNMWTTKWYPRDPKNVVDEMQHYLTTYGATNFPFQDLTAIVKRDWILAFCKEIQDRGLKINWQFPSGTRCEVIDDEVARALAVTGGRSLALAPESGSERTRKLIKKQMKTESLMNAVKASVRNGLNVTAFIVIGFPHDEPSDLKETRRLVRRLAWHGIDDVAVGFFFPIPNTQLYRELLAKGRIALDDDFLLTPIFANEEKLLTENNYCDHMTARQLTMHKYKILLNFYGVSFATRPWRVFQILWNALRGKETRKMETFLVDIRRKAGIAIRNRFRRRSKEPAAATSTS
jgi:anaerobic magnesium-protoporphyrin IX monomethyl ester cyclase